MPAHLANAQGLALAYLISAHDPLPAYLISNQIAKLEGGAGSSNPTGEMQVICSLMTNWVETGQMDEWEKLRDSQGLETFCEKGFFAPREKPDHGVFLECVRDASMKNSIHLFIGLKMSNARPCIGLHGRANTSGIKQGTKDSVPESGEGRRALHDRAIARPCNLLPAPRARLLAVG
ncbi:hypothetical protein L1987_09826 [Smallanthus sonchifolius]|uniref:Uncharacterized protein n=1 Tax=Smallanthus sonchifolius TaxID=185202 RepID=A0ACB9JQE1_9ASTR|nr:hypothetical protein L1987_09826 [Smallanthus sonchifolius]